MLLWRLLDESALSLDRYDVVVTVKFRIHILVRIYNSSMYFIVFIFTKFLRGGVGGGKGRSPV
jgi:hypothetical protein